MSKLPILQGAHLQDCPRYPTKNELASLLRIAMGLMGANDIESVLRTAGENLSELGPEAILIVASDDSGDSCYYLDLVQQGVHLELNHGICQRVRQAVAASARDGPGAAMTLAEGREVAAPFTDGVSGGHIALRWNVPPERAVLRHARQLLPCLAELAGARLANLVAQMHRDDEQFKIWAVTESRHVEQLRASEYEMVEVREQAAQDELTSLQNRRGFLSKSEQCLLVARRQGLACAVIFADVNGLKLVNDESGHAAGDALIRDAAIIFSSAFRHADVVGRVGGDEFAAFTFDNATPRAIIERIDAKIAQFNACRQGRHLMSLSIGVINCDIGGQEPLAGYLARADKEMYRQKRGLADLAMQPAAQASPAR
ncbi:GGDEF domain-containing protein [Massilia sp. SR12]